MKIVTRFLLQAWRPALVGLSLGLIAYLLYFHHLNTLTAGYAPVEAQSYQSAQTWHAVAQNPLNVPYKVPILALAVTNHHHLYVTRAVAAFFGVIAVIAFFYIARAWYGLRIGLFSTLLFATSAGLLHSARLGTPAILQMGLLALVGVLLWQRHRPRLHSYLTILVFGLALYIPGMVWAELLVIGLMHRAILRHWQHATPLHRLLGAVLAVASVAPLFVAIALHTHLLLPALGLSGDLHSFRHMASNLLTAVLSIGVHSNGNPLFWVDNVPLLNTAELVLAALGAYHYVRRERSLHSLLLGGGIAISLLLAALNGNQTSITSMVPLLYLLMAAGLKQFLRQWFTVFPRNPIARATGLTAICLLLFFSVLYQMRSYFVAWPHNAATHQAFRLPPT
ncbi:MAG TPA: hypothetical protein VLF69_01030 [Candidatus Saccharimonadales bacterium]|nr:hypothetical protein [Candidatus Saccharimonadales bacterium]